MENKKENYHFDQVRPYNQEEEKTAQLERMFDKISGNYDRLNDLMTFSVARLWRKSSLNTLKKYRPETILDIAAGTGDMSIESYKILHPKKVLAVDISTQMMEIGKVKVAKKGMSDFISFQVEDSASMSLKDNSFDAATISFGIRNFEKLSDSLTEIHRVLKPGGKLLILEVNEPKKKWVIALYRLYVRIFVMLTSALLSSDKEAYKYLTKSMSFFPQGKELIKIMEKHQFKLKKFRKYSFGVASMYLMESV